MTARATLLILLLACTRGPAQPGKLDPSNDSCTRCRMAVTDPGFAAQLAAPGEDPAFFDEIGCLRDFLKNRTGKLPRGSVAFVADHRTREWVRAAAAVYTRKETLETPMASHLIAHATAASRELDRAAQGGEQLAAAAIFGPAGPPDGAQ